MSAVEALCVYDYLAPASPLLLRHEWRRTSVSPASLLSHYMAHPAPRPSLLYVTSTVPPTLLFSLTYNNLLLLSPHTSEIEPLLVLEFLHRVVDVLEDYLGSPLLGSKIEGNYDIVAQLLNEMADDGFPFTTEPNALRDVVLPPSLMGKLLGSVTGLPSSSLPSSFTPSPTASLSSVPWRRANVKHTSNELFVDVLELVTATIAPSGRALAARVAGTIAFTSKLSGVPDLLLTLQAPGSYKQTLGAAPNSLLSYPVFHPCVRLSRWRERPGELSFVPPDGKFVLASYEVDLLSSPSSSGTSLSSTTPTSSTVHLPVNVELSTSLGPRGEEFECRVLISTSSLAPTTNAVGSSPSAFGSRGVGTRSPAFGQSANSTPVVEEVAIRIPLPPRVKALVATRCSRGEFVHENREIFWKIPPGGGGANAPSVTATFRTAVTVKGEDTEEDEAAEEGEEAEEQAGTGSAGAARGESGKEGKGRKVFRAAMPRCALVKFGVKGWLASGVRVESLKVVGGKGLGEGVKPYKGVKYITRSEGVEVRC